MRVVVRMPITLYRLGLGMLINAAPYMVLTTRGRKTGLPRHTALEYRQHGSKYYLISAWGRRSHWVQNLLAHPEVTFQCGSRTYAGQARLVDDAGEANRASQLFRKPQQTLYDRFADQWSANLPQPAEGDTPLTIVRLDRQPNAKLPLPPLQADMAWILPALVTVMTVALGLIVAARIRRS